MWDFSIAKSLSILFRTWPWLLLRAAVFGAFTAVFLIVAGSCGLIGHQLGPSILPVSDTLGGTWGVMAGMALGGAVIAILREYTLYLVKAGHIAVMVALLDRGGLPDARGQIAFGRDAVRGTFAESSVLFAFDQLVTATLKAVRERLERIGRFLPGLNVLMSFAVTVVEVAVTYVDEVVLAHIIRRRPSNPWRAGAETVVLYAQNGKTMLKNAFWLTLIMLVTALAVLAVLIGPVSMMVGDTVDATGVFAMVAAVAGAFVVLHVVLEPFAVVSLLQVFDQATTGQRPDPLWEDRLAERSEAFRELRNGGPGLAGAAIQPAE